MKHYRYVVIAILMLNISVVNAQKKSGYNFGVNITTTPMSYEGTTIRSQLPFGIHFGLNYEIPLNRRIGFQTGFLFSSKGAEYTINNSDYLIDPDYIEIPFNSVLNFGKKQSISIFAGPYFSCAFSGYKIEPVGGYRKLSFGSGANNDLKYIDAGFNFGVNLNVKHYIFSIQYGIGLRNLSPKSNIEMFSKVFGISFIQLRQVK